ncbi:9399_t:CDS:2 [Paraglomus brasilianum]|uniref:9399_t:CDS:1 n=1 Tax=Paraglomus brasilianum TaxID=144538 RepID=A0A9N9AUN3_9GLOM|nr:9399_t:CDS:2 [Paraglomus brasilianum]
MLALTPLDITATTPQSYYEQYQGQIKWIDFQELTDLKKLSSGAFGTVYSATWNLSSPSNSKEAKSQQVAIKYMDKCNFQLETLFHELWAHYAQCRYGNTNYSLALYGISQDPDTGKFMMIMEFAQNGDLQAFLEKHINDLTWNHKLEIVYQLADALCNLHGHKALIHRDLHSGNVLFVDGTPLNDDQKRWGFTLDKIVRISDYGLTQPGNASTTTPDSEKIKWNQKRPSYGRAS